MSKRKDVAKLAGVSEATVSRVFNNVDPLREETKRKVLEAAKQLNYQPNAIAQSFARGKSGNIGVIVPYLPKVRLLSTHYFSEILSGIGVKLAEHHYNLLLLFQSPNEPKDYVQLFHSQKVDACIILGSSDTPGEKEEIQRLHGLEHPYCLVNQTFSGEPFHSIDANHYEGSYEAVSLLLQKGFKRIGFLNGPPVFSNSYERLAGYQAALIQAGVTAKPEWIFQGNYSRTSGLQKAKEIGPLIGGEIDAIYAANDRMAIGLMQGLQEQGLIAGKDYALIGYDDSDVAKIVHPQLSSVHVPLFEMGQLAADTVLTMLKQGVTDTIHKRLPVTVIERTSI
ncbi:LacI family DNA-binding transcriptional regulator [Halalkalibacter urbisdiaboli]|uniref:LacI family DNA-binding transcriptional regulator n=1 Tax=Halalkalibacter urbisdiaboli TaxID=1960589 RepID=UPI000B43A9AC|nr:LacI family DNA-binding transcriptional regulator [Halalkalibacter urbisdiaboli]